MQPALAQGGATSTTRPREQGIGAVFGVTTEQLVAPSPERTTVTCSRAIRDSANSGISDGSARSSRCQTAVGISRRNSSGPMRVSDAVCRSQGSRVRGGQLVLAQPSSKPIEKVRTGSSLSSAMNESTRLESRPADRKQPSGTSLTGAAQPRSA